jgi:hypothetical protein
LCKHLRGFAVIAVDRSRPGRDIDLRGIVRDDQARRCSWGSKSQPEARRRKNSTCSDNWVLRRLPAPPS